MAQTSSSSSVVSRWISPNFDTILHGCKCQKICLSTASEFRGYNQWSSRKASDLGECKQSNHSRICWRPWITTISLFTFRSWMWVKSSILKLFNPSAAQTVPARHRGCGHKCSRPLSRRGRRWASAAGDETNLDESAHGEQSRWS